jgi:hypothetical protein
MDVQKWRKKDHTPLTICSVSEVTALAKPKEAAMGTNGEVPFSAVNSPCTMVKFAGTPPTVPNLCRA